MDLVGNDDGRVHSVSEITIGGNGGVKRFRVRALNNPMGTAKDAEPLGEDGRLVDHLTGRAEHIQRLPSGRRRAVHLASGRSGG